MAEQNPQSPEQEPPASGEAEQPEATDAAGDVAEKQSDTPATADAPAAPDAADDPTAEEALETASRAAEEIKRETADGEPLDLENFDKSGDCEAIVAGLNLLDDIDLQVTVELGRTRMYIEDVLRLNENSVVELDKAAGDSVDIYVNDRLVARGEVLVLNENFCVRINEIISQQALDECEAATTNGQSK